MRSSRYGRDVGDMITIQRGKKKVRVQVFEEDAASRVVGDEKGRLFRITKKHHAEVALRGPDFVRSVVKLTKDNRAYRRVVFTSKHLQLVVMSLRPNERIGGETHKSSDEFYRVESGEGAVVMAGRRVPLVAGDAVFIAAGTRHDIINMSDKRALKLYTILAPPFYPPNEVLHGKATSGPRSGVKRGASLGRKRSSRDDAPVSERFLFPTKQSADIFEYRLKSEGYRPRRLSSALVVVRAPEDVVRSALTRSRTFARDRGRR